MRTLSFVCVTSLALTMLTACQSTGPRTDAQRTFDPRSAFESVSVTNALDAALLQPASDFFTLGPGDQVEIEMLGSSASRTTATVGPDGKIYFNLLPGLDVWGLTLGQAKSLLEKELAQYVNAPQVTVTLRGVGSKYVWVLGRVSRPGVYPLTASVTLLEAIALAGGSARSASATTTEELADLHHSFVVRQGQVVPVSFYRLLREGDMSQNIYLRPDDFVYVQSALDREIYVLGSVRTPRAVPLAEQVTLVSAIAATGGPLNDAYLSHVAIVRGSLTDPRIAVVDYHAIVTGKAPDVRLEPHDIVYVPSSPYRRLANYLGSILTTFANTIAANEGANAVGGQPIGVAIPVGSR